MWATATDLARDRHGFEPLNADANDVFEQTEILPRADAAAMGSPCQQASWAAWVATQGTERQCAPPDGDHPMNQLYWKQVQPMKRRVKALLIEFLTGVLKVESASDPTSGAGLSASQDAEGNRDGGRDRGSVGVDTRGVVPELALPWVRGVAEETVHAWSVAGRSGGGRAGRGRVPSTTDADTVRANGGYWRMRWCRPRSSTSITCILYL